MKVTVSELRQMIRESVEAVVAEQELRAVVEDAVVEALNEAKPTAVSKKVPGGKNVKVSKKAAAGKKVVPAKPPAKAKK